MSRFTTTHSTVYIPPCLDCKESNQSVRKCKESTVNVCNKCTKSLEVNRCQRRKSNSVILAVDSLECLDCKKIASRVMCKCHCTQHNCYRCVKENVPKLKHCCKCSSKVDANCIVECEKPCCSKDYSCQTLNRVRESRIKKTLLPACRCRELKSPSTVSRPDEAVFCSRKVQLEKLRDTSLRGSRLCRCNCNP
uniref:Uncharacterized protein n=1 Tax=Anopheles funestus TaxID=62324 RepID=A0A182S0X8_ANOFN